MATQPCDFALDDYPEDWDDEWDYVDYEYHSTQDEMSYGDITEAQARAQLSQYREGR